MSSEPVSTNVSQPENAESQQKTGGWSSLSKDHVLSRFSNELKSVLDEAAYDEMYGVKLVAPGEGSTPLHTTLVILQKFLRANEGDLAKAKSQLLEALKWRKSYNPLAAKEEVFSKDKFGGLGYVTKVKGAKESSKAEDVVTFNIYGAAAKDPKKTFGDLDAFVRWRVALMELTLSHLDLNSATAEIPDYGQGPDAYQAIQVHDYLSVSFFRQPAEIKASSSKIIDLFQRYYPETVSYKYFLNVPLVMQFMMSAMKALMSKDSIQKMTWTSYGNTLVQYLGNDVPKEYGGTGPALEETAFTVKYDNLNVAPTATKDVEPTKTAEPAAQAPAEPKTETDAAATPAATAEADKPVESEPIAQGEGAPEVKKV